jgi:hypothetical protein
MHPQEIEFETKLLFGAGPLLNQLIGVDSMRVIVESPFAGAWSNVKYSRECIRDCLDRGESPFASHLLYTQKGVLNDSIPEERHRGIEAANGWLEVADYIVVYMDLGVTQGMLLGVIKAARLNKEIRLRWVREHRDEVVIDARNQNT